MILAGGRILDTDRQEELLDTLEDRINRTREQGELSPQTVIEAADRLGTASWRIGSWKERNIIKIKSSRRWTEKA